MIPAAVVKRDNGLFIEVVNGFFMKVAIDLL